MLSSKINGILGNVGKVSNNGNVDKIGNLGNISKVSPVFIQIVTLRYIN